MPPLSERARDFDPWDIYREGFPSGQRDQTVNLTRKLRWFESTPLHQLILLASGEVEISIVEVRQTRFQEAGTVNRAESSRV